MYNSNDKFNIENKQPITNAGVCIIDDYVKVNTDGDIAGIKMKLKGTGLIYRVSDDPTLFYKYANNILLMFSLNGSSLSDILFYFNNRISVVNTLVFDFFGNSSYSQTGSKYLLKESKYIEDDVTEIAEEKTIIERAPDTYKSRKNKSIRKKAYKTNLKLIPRTNFYIYKSKLIDDIKELSNMTIDEDLQALQELNNKSLSMSPMKSRGYEIRQITNLNKLKTTLQSNDIKLLETQEAIKDTILRMNNDDKRVVRKDGKAGNY